LLLILISDNHAMECRALYSVLRDMLWFVIDNVIVN